MTADYLLNENPYLRERDELLAHLVDDGTISAEAAAKERRRLRGICSEPDCDQPIDGWCEGCDAKLCAHHIEQHIRLSWQRSASGINANCGD